MDPFPAADNQDVLKLVGIPVAIIAVLLAFDEIQDDWLRLLVAFFAATAIGSIGLIRANRRRP